MSSTRTSRAGWTTRRVCKGPRAVNAAVTDVLFNRLVDKLNIATGDELSDGTVTVVAGPSGRARSSRFFRSSVTIVDIAAVHWMRITKNESVTRVRLQRP
jgi:hypothetical protein